MTTYQYAQGHNQSGSLADVDPQPRSDGIEWAAETHAFGASYDDGTALFYWVFSAIEHADMVALLTTLGFTLSADAQDKTVECTAQTNLGGGEAGTFDIVNALCHRPDLRGKDAGRYYRNVAVKFTDVEAI